MGSAVGGIDDVVETVPPASDSLARQVQDFDVGRQGVIYGGPDGIATRPGVLNHLIARVGHLIDIVADAAAHHIVASAAAHHIVASAAK